MKFDFWGIFNNFLLKKLDRFQKDLCKKKSFIKLTFLLKELDRFLKDFFVRFLPDKSVICRTDFCKIYARKNLASNRPKIFHFRMDVCNEICKKLPDKKSFKNLAISFKILSEKTCLAKVWQNFS